MKRTKDIAKQSLQAVGYVRVSSVMQREEGVSIEAQKEKIKQWARFNGVKLVCIYQDNGISGRNTNGRPGFQKAMEEVLRHKCILVCYSLSRLSRSMKDMVQIGARLNKAGCELVSTTEDINTTNATGKMVFHLLAVLNQFQADLIGEWTKMGLAKVRQDGGKTGGTVPFGHDVDADRKLIKNPAEQKVIQRIMKLHSTGWKFQTIGKRLNEKGIKTKTGKQWQAQTVKNVILANRAISIKFPKTSKP